MPLIVVVVVIVLVYAFLVGSRRGGRMGRFQDCDYAHRGMYDNLRDMPENSLLAFERACTHKLGIEHICLRLADGMIASIINQKDLNRKPVMNDGLQFLQIHLNASVSCQQDNILSRLCHGNTDGRRQVISHGSHGRIGNETLSFLYDISVAAGHTGRAVPHHRNLIFRKAAA